jgi:hypothetical protein
MIFVGCRTTASLSSYWIAATASGRERRIRANAAAAGLPQRPDSPAHQVDWIVEASPRRSLLSLAHPFVRSHHAFTRQDATGLLGRSGEQSVAIKLVIANLFVPRIKVAALGWLELKAA